MIAMHEPDVIDLSDALLLGALSLENRRPNLLVVCKGVAVSSVVEKVLEFCAAPFHFCIMPGQLDLPARKEGTLVLTDVSALTIRQQIALSDWLNRGAENVQVVSMCEASLKPLVDDGGFLEGLFYRLNVISMAATGVEEPGAPPRRKRARPDGADLAAMD